MNRQYETNRDLHQLSIYLREHAANYNQVSPWEDQKHVFTEQIKDLREQNKTLKDQNAALKEQVSELQKQNTALMQRGELVGGYLTQITDQYCGLCEVLQRLGEDPGIVDRILNMEEIDYGDQETG